MADAVGASYLHMPFVLEESGAGGSPCIGREKVLATMAPAALTAQSHLFQTVHSSETI